MSIFDLIVLYHIILYSVSIIQMYTTSNIVRKRSLPMKKLINNCDIRLNIILIL